MARTETLQVRLAPDELAKLRTAAAARGWTMAQLLRDMIRQLPDTNPVLKDGVCIPERPLISP